MEDGVEIVQNRKRGDFAGSASGLEPIAVHSLSQGIIW